jgi:hypothetical protein
MSGKTFLILQFLLCSLILYAQKPVDKKVLFSEAHDDFFEEDYKEALYNYQLLLQAGVDNSNINFKIGECYINIPGEETKAIPYLEKAVQSITPKYKDNTLTETKAPLHALYYLGNAYRINNEIDKALDVYNKFTNSPSFEVNYSLQIVETEIKACERAKLIYDKPVAIIQTNLGEPINNSASNYRAVVSADESVMVYMNDMKFYSAIFYSIKKDNRWSEPTNISPQIGSDGDMLVSSLSADGKSLYLVKNIAHKTPKTQGSSSIESKEPNNGNTDIYLSHLIDGKWSIALPLNKNINTNRRETNACESSDGKTLYFASDRRGGKGKLDLYFSKINENNEWGPATNLGEPINTPEDEDAPFITNNDNILFFCSKGHYNMGGYDIFYSIRKDYSWQEPINIGYPINTTGDDYFYMPVANGNAGYYSRILSEGKGKKDIYRIEILKGEPVVKDSNKENTGNSPLTINRSFNIKLYNKESNDSIIIHYNNASGKFQIEPESKYNLKLE